MKAKFTIEEIREFVEVTEASYAESALQYYDKVIKNQAELLKALEELLPLADDGYKYNCNACSHEEFLKEDRTLLMNARSAVQKARS